MAHLHSGRRNPSCALTGELALVLFSKTAGGLGRWDKVRPPSDQERKATALIELEIVEGAGKSRSGGPNEEPEDMSLPVWHGTVPVCPYHSET